MKKKKILFIIWSYTYGGGAEKILTNIVNNLNSEKYQIDIIEYWHTNINKENTNKNIKVLPYIIDAEKDSKIKKIIYKILLILFPRLIRRKYIKDKYDVEIAFNYMIPTFLLSKKCKTISWMHGDINDLKIKKIDYLLQKHSLKYVDKIIAISNNTYNSITNVFPEYSKKLVLLNNGYDLKKIKELAQEKIDIKSKHKYNILFINRFDSNKNPVFALNVLNHLLKQQVDVKLWFLGKGELEKEIITKSSELNISDNIEIIGYKSNPYPYIKFCDVVLGCSKSEGFPTIFIESLVLGKPFISTPVGGALEISDNGKCGIVANTFEEYVSLLCKLLEDDEFYNKLSEYGNTYVKKFSIEEQIKKIENILESL